MQRMRSKDGNEDPTSEPQSDIQAQHLTNETVAIVKEEMKEGNTKSQSKPNRKFPCPECPYSTDVKFQLKSHLLVHSGERPHKCPICNRAFTRKASLKVHSRTHTGECPYSCDSCGKRFRSWGHMKYHKSMHSGERPYPCGACGKHFRSSSVRTRHKLLHCKGNVIMQRMDSKDLDKDSPSEPQSDIQTQHSVEETAAFIKETEEVRKKSLPKFCCPHCPYSTNLKPNLTSHQFVHSGERPHKCPFCNKAATRKDNLKVHLRTHTGERPFVCDTCGRGFRVKRSLQYHERLHSGELPHSCDICGRRFRVPLSLTRHKLVHAKRDMVIQSTGVSSEGGTVPY